MISAQCHFCEIAMLKFMREATQVRNLFHVISAQSHLQKIVILRGIGHWTLFLNGY